MSWGLSCLLPSVYKLMYLNRNRIHFLALQVNCEQAFRLSSPFCSSHMTAVAWIKSMLSIFCLKHVIEYNSFEAANTNISEVIHRLPITNYVTFLHWLQCRLPKRWGYRHCKYQDGRSTSVMSDILGAYYWRWYRMNMAYAVNHGACCRLPTWGGTGSSVKMFTPL